MLYIPQIDDYLKILTSDKAKDSVAINFSEYFKAIMEEENLRKLAKLLCFFLTTPDEVEKYMESNYSDNCVHQYNVETFESF